MGGQSETNTALRPGKLPQKSSSKKQQPPSSVWQSPYDPLENKKQELPSPGELKAAIPSECFERSAVRSLLLVVRDLFMATCIVLATSQFLSTSVPEEGVWSLEMVKWVVGWGLYSFWMGAVLTGLWVLAHECGHGAFSSSGLLNDCVGFVLHQGLLVPYFSWKFTHAKHHRRTNHLMDGESHVPSTAKENGIGDNGERLHYFARWHEVMGDDAFAILQIWAHLGIGWPIYLCGFASTGRLAQDGTPLGDRVMDHWRPNSPMFTPKQQSRVLLSTIGTLGMLGLLVAAGVKFGFMPVFLWYCCPYLWVNMWLVLYTWLQHTDPSVPHYGTEEWTWVKGALSTIDRPYGIFDFFHHRIGSTHVAHHLFHKIPCYHAKKATDALKEYLEPKGLYNYNPEWWVKELWRVAKTCHYVQDTTGIQYYKSLNDLPKKLA
uniref:Fatty acid desaturase domain-containing protein n=1 Tax=Paramoeba aestuarina TaxID=180227 RepID=A0A7S4KWM6_9EUKA